MNKTLEQLIKKFGANSVAGSPQGEVHVKFDREELPKLFKELGFKFGAEVGVCRGEFSELLCKGIPGLKFYGVDPWSFVPVFKNFRKQSDHDKNYEEALNRLNLYDATLIRQPSMEGVKEIEDEVLDFVYIDGDHRFEFVINDIAEWSKKVKKGGIVCGDDFGMSKTNSDFHHVEVAVRAWCVAHEIKTWFVLERRNGRHFGWQFMWVKE